MERDAIDDFMEAKDRYREALRAALRQLALSRDEALFVVRVLQLGGASRGVPDSVGEGIITHLLLAPTSPLGHSIDVPALTARLAGLSRVARTALHEAAQALRSAPGCEVPEWPYDIDRLMRGLGLIPD